MSRLFPLLFIISILCFNTSCKTSKGTDSKLKKRSTTYLQKKMIENQVKADWFSTNAKVVYQNGNQILKASSSIKMRKDSVIWISVKKFGFEAARVQITTDSIYILDRINAAYMVKGMNYISEEFNLPANFNTLQAILLGNPVFFSKDLEVENEALNYHLMGESSNIKNDYWLNGVNYQLQRMDFFDKKEQRNLKNTLESYQLLADEQNFSYFRRLELQSQKTGQLSIELTFSKIEINVPKNIRFEIPSKYTRMD